MSRLFYISPRIVNGDTVDTPRAATRLEAVAFSQCLDYCDPAQYSTQHLPWKPHEYSGWECTIVNFMENVLPLAGDRLAWEPSDIGRLGKQSFNYKILVAIISDKKWIMFFTYSFTESTGPPEKKSDSVLET